MKAIIKGLVEKVRGIRNRLRYNKVIKNVDTDGTQLFIDIGSSSIKASIGNEYITFRASIREVTNRNELTIANNVICVDDKYFVIAESNTPVQNVNLKCDKKNLNVLVLYAVKLLKEKIGNIDLSNIQVNTMLPFNQLGSTDNLEKVINGMYNVQDLKGNEVTINLTLNQVMCEGETSLVYFNSVNSNKCDNTVILNFGNSTIDGITFDNIQNARQELITINQGTNLLFTNYLKYLPHIPNSSLLGSFLKSGKFKFTKEEQKGINLENELYLKSIWYDVESLIKKVNPYSTNIIITGGGAMVLHEAIREVLGDRYNIILPSKEDAIYSDLKGLKLICSNSNNDIVSNNNKDVTINESGNGNNEEMTIDNNSNVFIDNKSLVTNDQAEKVTSNKVTDKKKSNFDLFITLRDSGYSLKQIYENNLLELSYGTLKNYNSKYKKIAMI